jgi:hypothetical protein
MKFWVSLFAIVFAFFFSNSKIAADEHDGESRFDQDLDENDFQAVKNFVQSKKAISFQDKIPNLWISGDVRAAWRYICEKQRGENLRGGDGVFIFRELEQVNDEIYEVGERLPISHNDFDLEFNLRIDYVADRAWCATQLTFDESGGVDDNGIDCCLDPEGYHGSGSCDNLCLKKAYIGYEVCNFCGINFYIELGRRGQLYDEFDSQIQFLSRLDGIVLTFAGDCGGFAAWYSKWAGFIVDERVNHGAWATEFGLLNICDTGFDFKYSFIDWVKRGRNRCFADNPIGFKFRNSQFLLTYNFLPEFLRGPAQIYGAVLWNHTPVHYTFVHGVKEHIRRSNIGWYVGFRLGQVYREGDWSCEVMYAVVQAQCMPDNDVRNIGRGNVLHNSFTADARGNTNWRGWQFNGLYALTDNLALSALIEYSRAYDHHIGGAHMYSNVRVEAIYAF